MKQACIVLIAVAGVALAEDASRPNFVVIMCDDMGYSDIGCFGGEIETPNLDRLAAGGMRFTQFYNTARCCPSRASIMTGLYPHQAGVGKMVTPTDRRGYEGRLTDRCVTVAEVLRDAGYQTRISGKWHLSPFERLENKPSMPETWPLQRGFDHWFGTICGAGSFFTPMGLMRDNTIFETEDPDFYYTDAISEAAAEFIRDCAAKAAPFYLYVAYTAPHWPLHARPADIETYATRYRDGWDVLRAERYARMREMGIIDAKWPLSPPNRGNDPWEEAEHKEWEIRRMAVYAAMVYRMDQGIGRVLAALEEVGVSENTLVMFIADNGGCAENVSAKGKGTAGAAVARAKAAGRVCVAGNDPSIMPGSDETFQSYGPTWANASNTPFRWYKKWAHEGGIATPFIAYWPKGIANPGSISTEVGHIIDLVPTVIDAAGAAQPETYKGKPVLPLEGKSLVPVFSTGTREGHAEIGWEHNGNRALRRGKWKLVAMAGKRWELYNMEADRTELHDLSKEKPDHAREMAKAWEAWAKRTYVKE